MKKELNIEYSLVIPAYKAGNFIIPALLEKIRTLDSLKVPYELLIVLDGPDPEITAIDLQDKLQQVQNLKVISLPRNFGKGRAVRTGMLEAKGDYVGYMDVDNDIDPAILRDSYLLMKNEKLDFILPSKHIVAAQVNFPKERKLYGNVYHRLLSSLFGESFSDTQVGMKLYRKEVLNKILPDCRINGFAFEIEMLTLARLAGYTSYKEIPVTVNLRTKSTIRLQAGLKVLWDTALFYFRYLKLSAAAKGNEVDEQSRQIS